MSQQRTLPRSYQAEGVDFLAAREKALLAFDTRLGKSATALWAAEKVFAQRVLIIGPAISRLSWVIEVQKALGYTPFVVKPGMSPPVTPARVVVVAYDALSNDTAGWTKHLANIAWDVLILDEAQYLKTPGANRTKAVYGKIAKNAKRVWLLTASPTPNHAGEFYPHYRALWPDTPPLTKVQFEDQFCRVDNTPWGRRIKGTRKDKIEEFRAKFAPHILRKTKRDVIADMPAVQHNTVPVEIENAPAWSNMDASALDQLLESGDNVAGGSVTRALGEAKAPQAAKWIAEQLSNDTLRNVVVFAWHRSVLDLLQAGLAEFDPVRLDGATSEKARGAAVEAFQAHHTRVFLGQIKAAGTAICLDAADDVVVVEPSWVPMENYQACSRVENVAERKPVTVSWITSADETDKKIMSTLARKTAEVGAIWD